MTPYLIVFSYLAVLLFMTKQISNTKGIYYINVGIIFIVLVLLAGLRSSSVGTDTSSYVWGFESYRTLAEMPWNSTKSYEIGFLFIEKLARIISDNYLSLLLIVAVIVLFFYFKAILSLSENFMVSIFVFVTIDTYLFGFNGMRQAIAAAIFSLAVVEIVRARPLQYFLWTFVAILFHKSVLIMLPFYYLIRLKFSLKSLFYIFSYFIVALILFDTIMSFLPSETTNKYQYYLDRNATGGKLLTVYFAMLTLFFIFMRRYIKKETLYVYDIYLNMNILFTFMYVIVALFGLDVTLMRISIYFALGGILLWPIVLSVFSKDFPLKILVYMLFIAVHFLFFYVYIEKIADLTPYIFNLEGVL